jgi:hypothetical protein
MTGEKKDAILRTALKNHPLWKEEALDNIRKDVVTKSALEARSQLIENDFDIANEGDYIEACKAKAKEYGVKNSEVVAEYKRLLKTSLRIMGKF